MINISPLLIFGSTLILAIILAKLVLIDLRTRRLPDRYTLSLIVIGLALNACAHGGLPTAEIWGVIFGYSAFWAIGTAYFKARGIEGLGLGDAKLLAAAGAWLGFTALPMLVLLSALGALCAALFRGLSSKEHLAFGPWLAAAFFMLWVIKMMPSAGLTIALLTGQ